MSGAAVERTGRAEWRVVEVSEVVVVKRRRELDTAHVEAMRESFRRLGGQLQLQPIVLDGDLRLIDGAHRLAAAKAEGWKHVSAVIFSELLGRDASLLEVEANRIRKELSPLELSDAWEAVYRPAFFEERAKQRSLRGVTAVHRARGLGTPGSLHGNTVKTHESPAVSLVDAARRTTGKGLDWLNKIAEIKAIANSASAPDMLRSAALRGVQKLSKPYAKVEPVYRELLAIRGALESVAGDRLEAERNLRSERALDRLLTELSLLAERLDGRFAEELLLAAKLAPFGNETLRAARVSAIHVLAGLIALECRTAREPRTSREKVGAEAVRMLADLSAKREQVTDARG